MANDVAEVNISPEEAKEAAKKAHSDELKEFYRGQSPHALPPDPFKEFDKIVGKLEPPKETETVESKGPKTSVKQKEKTKQPLESDERRINRYVMRISNEGVNTRRPVREILPFSEKDVLTWGTKLEVITEKLGEEEANPSGLPFGKSIQTPGTFVDHRLTDKRVKVWNPGKGFPIFIAVFDLNIPPEELYQDDVSLPEVVIRLNKLGEAAIIRPDERPIRPDDPEYAYSSTNIWHSFLDKVSSLSPGEK